MGSGAMSLFSVDGPIFGTGAVCKSMPYEITSQQQRGSQEITFERGLSETRAQISAEQMVKLPNKPSLLDSQEPREKPPGLRCTLGQMERGGGLPVRRDVFRTLVPTFSAPPFSEGYKWSLCESSHTFETLFLETALKIFLFQSNPPFPNMHLFFPLDRMKCGALSKAKH